MKGELTVRVTRTGGNGRFDRIVKMIEESERLKSSLESKAERLAARIASEAGITEYYPRGATTRK